MSFGATLKSNCLDGAQLPIPTFKVYPQNLTAFPHTGGDFFFHIKNGKRGDLFDISSAIIESLSKYNVRFTEIGDAYAYRVFRINVTISFFLYSQTLYILCFRSDPMDLEGIYLDLKMGLKILQKLKDLSMH